MTHNKQEAARLVEYKLGKATLKHSKEKLT